MGTKHTPGSWRAEGFDVVVGKGAAARTVCIAHNVPGAPMSRIANARLISAAPELLEALQKMLAPFEGGCLCGHFESCPICSRSSEEYDNARKARAAIAKATEAPQ